MNCRICGNAQGNRSHRAREMMFGTREVFAYNECSHCGCVQIAAVPADMSPYYPADYYSLVDGPPPRPASAFARRLQAWRDRYAVTGRGSIGRAVYALKPADVLRSLAPVGLRRESRVLDVGSGAGTLLFVLYALGFRKLLGIDPFIPSDLTYPDGPTILKRTIHEVDPHWDLIMFHHAFEHLPDPSPTLEACARLLDAGGVCLIRIPTASSYAWRHYGVNWVQLDAPRHHYLHTLDSMRILADRTGFVVERVEYDSTAFQFWGSEQYVRGIPLMAPGSYEVDPSSSIFTRADIDEFRRNAARLNAEKQGDSAAFYLRKAG